MQPNGALSPPWSPLLGFGYLCHLPKGFGKAAYTIRVAAASVLGRYCVRPLCNFKGVFYRSGGGPTALTEAQKQAAAEDFEKMLTEFGRWLNELTLHDRRAGLAMPMWHGTTNSLFILDCL